MDSPHMMPAKPDLRFTVLHFNVQNPTQNPEILQIRKVQEQKHPGANIY